MTTAAIKQTVAQQSLVGLLLASGLTGMLTLDPSKHS